MITRFYDERARLKYCVRLLNTRYALIERTYMGTSYSEWKTRGYHSEEDGANSLLRQIKDKYTYEFNEQGEQIYCKNNENGSWFRKTFDGFGNWVGFERSSGISKSFGNDYSYDIRFWKITYKNGILMTYEDSDGNWWDKNVLPMDSPPYEPIRIGNGNQLWFPEPPNEGTQLKLDLEFS